MDRMDLHLGRVAVTERVQGASCKGHRIKGKQYRRVHRSCANRRL